MTTIERKIAPGKWWHAFAAEVIGYEIEAVSLMGQKRPWPLRQVTKQEFTDRVPLLQFGHNHAPVSPSLWSIPTMWMVDNKYVYLWPAPKHNWTLQVHLRERA